MQAPAAMEAADEVLQVLDVCEAIEETREVIVTTIEEDPIRNSPPVASCGAGTKPSQVRRARRGPWKTVSYRREWRPELAVVGRSALTGTGRKLLRDAFVGKGCLTNNLP